MALEIRFDPAAEAQMARLSVQARRAVEYLLGVVSLYLEMTPRSLRSKTPVRDEAEEAFVTYRVEGDVVVVENIEARS